MRPAFYVNQKCHMIIFGSSERRHSTPSVSLEKSFLAYLIIQRSISALSRHCEDEDESKR